MNFYINEAIIELEGRCFQVLPLPHDISSLEEDECYSFDGLALIYRGKIKHRDEIKKSGLYIIGEELITHILEEDKDVYVSSKIKELNVADMIEEIMSNGEKFTNTEDMEVIQNNAEITMPVIKDCDDFLTRIVKQVIISKKINLKNYEQKISKSLFTNMKSSLNTPGRKMSVLYFRRWAEILGFDYQMAITDDGTDSIAPIKDSIEYDSAVDPKGEY